MGRGGGLRLGFQIGEIRLAEGALNDLEMEGQIRSEFRVECIEQETTQLLAAGACQARPVPDRSQGVELPVGAVLADFLELGTKLGGIAQSLFHPG